MKQVYLWSLLIVSHSLFASSLTPIAESTCQAAYLDLFKRSEIRMTIALGYFDTSENLTIDRRGLNFYEKTLTQKCIKWDQKMCGFTLLSSKPSVFSRKVLGPDGLVRTLKVIIDASSVGDSDKENRLDPRQTLQTKRMRDLFRDGLENSEITFYHGHSRDGGGPSFGPPVLTRDGHVDYPYYQKRKDDKKFLIDVLAKSPNKSRIVGIASCSSLRWFSSDISLKAPASGIIGTTSLFTTRVFEESLVFMENIMSYKCLKELRVKDALNEGTLVSGKDFRVSEKSKHLSKNKLDQQTLEALATQLSSKDQATRRTAFLEIKSYDDRLYSARVWQELANYSFANIFLNGHGF